MSKNIYRFTNNLREQFIGNEGLKKISFAIEDLMTKYLKAKAQSSKDVEQAYAKYFAGKGVFETVSPERENDSIEVLNNKITAGLFEASLKQYDPSEQVKFDVEGGTFLPDARTKILMKSPNLWQSSRFRDIFMTNYTKVITPAAYAIMISFYEDLAEVFTCDFGDNIAITVESNEIIVVQPIAQDTLKFVKQSLKKKEYILTPRPHGARVNLNFYDLASGKVNWAEHIIKIARGFTERLNQMKIEALYDYVSNATSNFTVNTQFFKTTLNTTNWDSVVEAVSAANSSNNVVAYGTLKAITQILPNTTVPTMDSALATLVGKEWVNNGYIGEYHGATVRKLNQKFLPGTINAAGQNAIFGAPDDIIYFVSENDRPLKVGIEGNQLYVNKDETQTGDATIDFLIVANFDVIYVPANKIGAIYLGQE